MAGATTDQAKRIMFQRVDGTFWRINGDAVGTALTVDDDVTTKLTFNPGAAQTNTVLFGTGAQLAPVCAASATCAVEGGTGRLAIRLNNGWSCVP